jgi:hypothetical protein
VDDCDELLLGHWCARMFSSVAALEEKKSSSCIPRVFAQSVAKCELVVRSVSSARH